VAAVEVDEEVDVVLVVAVVEDVAALDPGATRVDVVDAVEAAGVSSAAGSSRVQPAAVTTSTATTTNARTGFRTAVRERGDTMRAAAAIGTSTSWPVRPVAPVNRRF
jgi:hypothetical protein